MKNLMHLKLTLCTLSLMLFTTCSDDDTIQYRLTTQVTPAETGTLTPVSGMYNEGTEIELKATPNEEYIFTNWTGDASGNVNPLTIIMLEDKNITAVFEKVKYSLTIDIVGEGIVNQEIVLAKTSSTDYESGKTVQLTAVPDDEWEFEEWSGDYTGTENPIQITIDKAMSIVATFEDNSEKTYVPDDNFEKALIDLGYDDEIDNYIKSIDVLLVEDLDISNKNISDITGLEAFESLVTLDASNNKITSIDPFFGSSFGAGFKAGTLILSDNDLSDLDVSELHILGLLDVTNNPLTCIQVNENQLSVINDVGALVPMIVKKDEGVIISLDCGS